MRPLLAAVSAAYSIAGAPAAPAYVQRAALRCAVNWSRRHYGRAPLRHSSLLDHSALLRALAIRRCHAFSHTPCGQSFIGVFESVGYLGRSGEVGENLFWGSSAEGTARVTLHEWLTSPEHRSNLFYHWRDFGVALLKDPLIFGAPNVSIWVMQFGRRG